MIRFNCPKCQKSIKAAQGTAGRLARCPGCQAPLEIPALPAVVVPASGSVPPIQKEPAHYPAPVVIEDQHSDSQEQQDTEPAIYDVEWEALENRSKTGMIVIGGVGAAIAGLFLLFVILAGSKQKAPEKTASVSPSRPQAPRQYTQPEVSQLPDPPQEQRPPSGESTVKQLPPQKGRTADEAKTELAKNETKGPPAVAGLPNKPDDPDDNKATRESESLVSGFTSDMKSKSSSTRIKGARALGELGSKAFSASQALCEAMLDLNPSVKEAASESLEKVNPNLHAVVLPMIVEGNQVKKMQYIRNLGQLGTDGRPALPLLLIYRQAHHGGPDLIRVMAAIAPDDRPLTANFASWITKDKDAKSRVAMAELIPKMAGGKEYVKTLITVIRTDPDNVVKVAAINAIGEFGPDAKAAESVLRLAKSNSEEAVRNAAARALILVMSEQDP